MDGAALDPVAFGRRLRELRRQRGLKQSDVAGGEISTAYVSRIEAGQRRPEPAVVALLAERLGTTPEYLLTGVGADAVAEARLALRYAELALHSGEPVEAEAQLRRLVADDAGALGPLQLQARLALARALEDLGRLDEAIHELESLREAAPGADLLELHVSLSRCYRESGDLARSIDVAEAGLALGDEVGLGGDDRSIRLAVTLAAAYFERGDAAYAAHLCRTALERAEQTASPAARAAALWNSSAIASERGQTDLAVALAERALALLGETADERAVARLRLQHGIVLLRLQPPDVAAAEAALLRARADFDAHGGGPVDVARCDATLSSVRLAQGAADEALRLALQARELAGDTALVAAEADIAAGKAHAAAGDNAAARQAFAAAAATLTAAASDRSAALVWFELADLLEEAGDYDAARAAYRSAAASLGMRAAPRSARIRTG